MTDRSFRLFRAASRVLCGLACLTFPVGSAQAPPRETAVKAVKAPLAQRSLFLDVAAHEGRLVAVGERGHIMVSADSGGTWTQAEVPAQAMLTGVWMQDAKLGWAVGHDEIILRTRDGGLNWEKLRHQPDGDKPLLDVWFADARNGVAVGAYGRMLSTEDGGDTWQARQVHGEDDFHLNQIAAASDGTLYLAAEAGHLYRSDDRGREWKPLPSPYKGSFFGVLPLSDGPLLAFGLRGNVFRSPDRGATWQKVETGTDATLTAGLELGPGRLVLGGMAGTLLWSEDGGRSLRKQELPDRKAIVALSRGDDRHLHLYGEGGMRKVEIPR